MLSRLLADEPEQVPEGERQGEATNGGASASKKSSNPKARKVRKQSERLELLKELKVAIRAAVDFAAIKRDRGKGENERGTTPVKDKELDERDALVQELCRSLECCFGMVSSRSET